MAIIGYQYRMNGGEPVSVGLVYEHLVTGLEPSTTYNFELRKMFDDGEFSAWTAVVQATTFGALVLVNDEGEALVNASDEVLITYGE